MLLGILRLAFLTFAVLGIASGVYELIQGSGQGVYDLGGGLMWGLFFLILTAWQNKKDERRVGYVQSR